MQTSISAGVAFTVFAMSHSVAQAQNAPADRSAGNQLDEIMVTAQRRAENVQDVPITVSTITAAAAQEMGIIGTETLSMAVPGLVWTRQIANGGVPFIRGVGTSAGNPGTESPVAVYVDDVYVGIPAANLFNFNNIESAEVLKGPQGTLFGRNATAGVIHIKTRRPSHEASIDATVGVGNYDTTEAALYATGPLSKAIAANLSLSWRDQADGYGQNVITGQEVYYTRDWGARAELLFEPTTSTSLLFSGDYISNDSDGGLNAVIQPTSLTVGGGRFVCEYCTQTNPADSAITNQSGGSLRIDHDFGRARLVSISATRHAKLEAYLDQDASPQPVVFTFTRSLTTNYSQEFQVLTPTDTRLQAIGGVFFLRSDAGFKPLRVSGTTQAAFGGFNDLYNEQVLESIAGFGEFRYSVTPSTNVTLGLRYTTDSYEFTTQRTDASGAFVPGNQFTVDDSDSEWTYRAVLDHHFSPDVMAYASLGRGFKSGGYNLSAPTVVVGGVPVPAPTVLPEILDAAEIGLKTELFERALRVNVSAFYYDYSNLQVTVVFPGSAQTLNAAAARMKGLDIDFSTASFGGFTFSGGVSLLDAEYSEFPNGPLFVPNPAVCAPSPRTTGPLTGGNALCASDLTGNQTIRSPEVSYSLSTAYAFPTTAIGDFSLSATLSHTSKFFWEPGNRVSQPETDLLNAALSWKSRSGKYEAGLWGKNLLDEYYYTYASESTVRGDSGIPALPMTYGASFGVHF